MKTSDQYKKELEAILEDMPLTKDQKYDIMWKAGMIQSCAKLETMDRCLELFNLTNQTIQK